MSTQHIILTGCVKPSKLTNSLPLHKCLMGHAERKKACGSASFCSCSATAPRLEQKWTLYLYDGFSKWLPSQRVWRRRLCWTCTNGRPTWRGLGLVWMLSASTQSWALRACNNIPGKRDYFLGTGLLLDCTVCIIQYDRDRCWQARDDCDGYFVRLPQ
jgi:hypothetical protein